jgi:pSer/pThr/pTyr-binding forkhead associated (FHA) protein
VLTISELRQLAGNLDVEKFTQQLGPFVLIQRPPDNSRGNTLGATQVRSSEAIPARIVALLFMFEDLAVASLPPLRSEDVLTVGRLPDCDLITNDASVSKRHARLEWDGATRSCSVVDLQSTNGTFLNTGARVHERMSLRDGDVLTFGDTQFWYLLTETLHAKLRQYQHQGLGSFTG